MKTNPRSTTGNIRAGTTDPVYRQLLSSELEIGEHKMTHWERHPNWNVAEATRIAQRLKLQNPSLPDQPVALTIPNRYRPEKVEDIDLEVGISEFLATRGVTKVKANVSAPRPKPTKRSNKKFGR